MGGINACKGKVNYIDMLSALAERIYPKMQLICFLIFGSYALHTDPKSEAILDVCHFEDEMTRDRLPRVYKVVWVLVVFSCFVGHCCQRVVVAEF